MASNTRNIEERDLQRVSGGTSPKPAPPDKGPVGGGSGHDMPSFLDGHEGPSEVGPG
jgi:hypothetical protein